MEISKQTPKFITLEGIEGAGKSTQLGRISDYIRSKGIKVYTTHEPGGTQLGEAIRQWLLDSSHSIAAMTELLLFYAARVQHIEKQIEPMLQNGYWVICDRFIDSSYAYQGGGRNIPLEHIAQLNQFTISIQPDLTLLLDINPEQIHQRISCTKLDRFEKEETAFFTRVRNTYLQCAQNEPKRIKIIDGTQSIDQVTRALVVHLESLLKCP